MHKTVKSLLWAGAAVAVPLAVNALITRRAGWLENPLPGDIGYYDWVYGRVAFYRMGVGDPLLLVHHPHPGGSAWEWRNIFPELANHHTVYALDLLGFGLSDRPNVGYGGAMYADLVHDFLQDVVGVPTMAVGSVLGASYVVNAAVRRPELISGLVLSNPTGTLMHQSASAEGATWATLHTPVLGASLYNALMTRANIERVLTEQYYYDPQMVSAGLVRYIYTAAHQPGSQFAAASYLSGRLDLPMRMAFSSITQPTLLIWGRDAYYTPLSNAADLLYRHPNTTLQIIDECGMFPHDEKAGEALHAIRQFELCEKICGDQGEEAA